MFQGKYEDTIKECNKALELSPTYMKALVRRGEAHEKLENYEEALAGRHKFKMITSASLFCIIECQSFTAIFNSNVN